MAKIKIKDLPADLEISEEEMKKVTGGAFDAHLQTFRRSTSLVDARSERLQKISEVSRFVLPNMMHDAGP